MYLTGAYDGEHERAGGAERHATGLAHAARPSSNAIASAGCRHTSVVSEAGPSRHARSLPLEVPTGRCLLLEMLGDDEISSVLSWLVPRLTHVISP